jgi:hypothetical protein
MTMNRATLLVLTVALALPAAADVPVRQYQFLSDVYTIEKQYKSMEGPASMTRVYLLEGPPELLWITGVKTEMVSEDGTTPQLPELMCHVNVDLDAGKHAAMLGLKRNVATRLITLSQGITDTKVPDGFGFPVASNEPLLVYTQVLNHNLKEPKGMKVRHRVTFEFIRDSEAKKPIKPLMNLGASGTVFLNENPLAISSAFPTSPGVSAAHAEAASGHPASCLMLQRAPNAAGMSSDYVDPSGRKLTGHWIVPPGRQVNHSDITWFMGLPFDTKLHYAAVHLHPFAESLTLRDATADKVVFTARAKNPEGRVGLDHVDTFISHDGVPLYKDHKYELISVYNNTTSETHDSMASVFFGFADREFVKPTAADLIVRTANLEDLNPSDGALLKTTAGEFGVRLSRDLAPETAKQFARLMRAGAFDGAKATRVLRQGQAVTISFTIPLDSYRRKLLRQLPQENGAPHQGVALSFCPQPSGSKELTLDLVIGAAPDRDGRCVAFATALTLAGSPALLELAGTSAEAPPDLRITGGELFNSSAPPPAKASM